MNLPTVLLIALGSFFAGLAVCIDEHRLTLVAVENVAFAFALPGVLAYAGASGRAGRRGGRDRGN